MEKINSWVTNYLFFGVEDTYLTMKISTILLLCVVILISFGIKFNVMEHPITLMILALTQLPLTTRIGTLMFPK